MGAPFPPIRRSPLLRKAALVPLWILQLVVMFGIIGTQVYLGTATKGSSSLGGPETLIYMSLAAFCAILTLVEIAVYAAHKLRPLPYLILQLVKLVIWLTLLGLWVAAMSTAGGIPPTTGFIVQLVESVLPVLTFLTPTLYASITYHRHRHTRSHTHTQQRLFSLESGRYPEVSEKTLARNVWPVASDPIPSELHNASSTLVAGGTSPLSPHFRQELGDEGWVVEMEGGEEGCEKDGGEVYELAAVRTPKTRSRRESGDAAKSGSRKGSRGRLGEALSPKTRSRRGSGDAMGSGKGGRKGSRGRLGEVLSPKTRSRRVSGDAAKMGSTAKTRVQRVDKRTMW